MAFAKSAGEAEGVQTMRCVVVTVGFSEISPSQALTCRFHALSSAALTADGSKIANSKPTKMERSVGKLPKAADKVGREADEADGEEAEDAAADADAGCVTAAARCSGRSLGLHRPCFCLGVRFRCRLLLLLRSSL